MPPTATQSRTYAAAHFALELDNGQPGDLGLFRSIEGGGIRVDSMTYQSGGSRERIKRLGKPRYEDFKLQVGMSMSEPFYEWIAEFFDGKGTRKSGAVVAADFSYAERARRTFTEALIREVTFPKLDAVDKNAAYMGVTIAVENIEFKPGGGQKITPGGAVDRQKLWTACNFSMTIDGHEAACARISKVEGFTVKQTIIEHNVGGFLAAQKVPSVVDFPNLVFTLPSVDATALYERLNEAAVKGKYGNGLHGELTTQDSSGADLFRVEYFGGSIVNITPEKLDAGSEEISQVKVEMQVERMTFKYLG